MGLPAVQAASAAGGDKAVATAKSVFFTWRDVLGPERRDVLLRLADLVEQKKQALAEVESLGWAENGMSGKIIPCANVHSCLMTVHEPVGVVGCIIPLELPDPHARLEVV